MLFSTSIPKGKYVVAVSGGVDSMVLLNELSNQPDLELVVAHFNHGIRSDSDSDRVRVEQVAKAKKLFFVYEEGMLGAGTSEALARKARYDFLKSVAKAHQAKAIITAHHQDDVLETAIINLLRGTGRRGISSLRSTDKIVRPLLSVPKETLIAYALANKINWLEDPSNNDPKYLRNYVRHHILTRFSLAQKKELLRIINSVKSLNEQIDEILDDLVSSHLKEGQLDRQWFIMLPNSVSKEVLASWFRREGLSAFDRKMLQKIVVAAKTFSTNKTVDLYNNCFIKTTPKYLALTTYDR